MGLFDILRGQRAPKRANLDRLFALTTAAITLDATLGLRSSGAAGLCFKQLEAGAFEQLVRDIDELLTIAGRESDTRVSRHTDQYGLSWVLLKDPDFDDLVSTTHIVSQTMEERGYSPQLLCAVFGFHNDEGTLELIYNYKRGTFYPFAPSGERTRDNARELRLKASLEHELPFEPELERWYAVWDAPVHPDGP